MKFNFEEVYQAYKDMVYNFVFWKVKSHEDALDLSQEIFFKVYKHLKNFREESSIKTWIMKIAMNHVKDFYKKQGKRMLDMEFDEEGEQEIPEIAVEEHILMEDEVLVERALSKLKDWEREVLVLYYMEGFQYEEIADILEIPIGTVKSRLNSAKKSLRKVVFGGVCDGK
ncbi:MAG: RNA polymerase sigma factor [candidate division WOR-3 bacterium]